MRAKAKAKAKPEAEEKTVTTPDVEIKEGQERQVPIPETLGLLPLKNSVLFPKVVMPLMVELESSIKLIDDAIVSDPRLIGVVAKRDSANETPDINDLYPVGVAAQIHTMIRLPDGQRLIVQGLKRIRVKEVVQSEPYFVVKVEEIPDEVDWAPEESMEMEALRRNVADTFKKFVALAPNLPDELENIASVVSKPATLSNTIALHMPIPISEKQELLETTGIKARLTALLTILIRETQLVELGSKIQSQVHEELGKTQKEYYLREQIRAIQRELGEGDERTVEMEELRQQIEKSKMPAEAKKEAHRELDRLKRMPPAAPEYTVSRTYIDWLLAIPWDKSTEDNLDIIEVRKTLDQDHYGLDKVKERILEYLSVRRFKTTGTIRHPILCFVGPPGVGKTSLGRSIARAMGRNFVRMSLGGIRDEAEIRGHRRTYVGALPGQIVQSIRRADSDNPVFMLDEIDKVGKDFRGDPSSALLEVLDPEQNNTFRDHYLEVPFDLSKVMFITTANMLDTILPPLRDRMEVLEVPGYTEEEKLEIAKRHLVPKQLAEHGLNEGDYLAFTDEAISDIIRGYTREAGVRNLEREIASVCRKVTREFAEGRKEMVTVDVERVRGYLGAPRYLFEEIKDRINEPGVAIGLAWTPVGGDVLFVEATRMLGSKAVAMTGQLGRVMKESAHAAMSFVRSKAPELGIDPKLFIKSDFHIHVPSGAIPKDGPSAGITMVTALASLLTQRKVRSNLAMTGEITLRGKVLPVGGIKEKVLAARRAGVDTIILPKQNEKDVMEDIAENIRSKMRFVYADDISTVLEEALEPPTEKEEQGKQSAARKKKSDAADKSDTE